MCASSLARQTGSEHPCSLTWICLRQVGVTVKSKYLNFPLAAFAVAPSGPFCSGLKPFFHLSKDTTDCDGRAAAVPSGVQPSTSTAGCWSLTQMDSAGGRWHLPFHCLERSFSGLTLLSLILVLCNSITLVKLCPDLCQWEWTEYQPLSLLLSKVWCYTISGHHHVLVVQQIRIMFGKSLVLQFNLC